MAFAHPIPRRFALPAPQLFDPGTGAVLVPGPPPLPSPLPPPGFFVRGPDGPVFVVRAPVRVDHNFMIRMDLQRTDALIQFMEREGLMPSMEEEVKRRDVVEQLKHIVMDWVKKVAWQYSLPKDLVSITIAAIMPYGSYGLGVAKESADVIILDDNFSTIVTVTKQGRSVYINIHKFVQFKLMVNIVALIVNFSSACFTGNASLTAVMGQHDHGYSGSTCISHRSITKRLDEKNTNWKRTVNFISNVMWRNIFGQAFYQFIMIWFPQTEGKMLFQLKEFGVDVALNTLIFNSFVFCQLFRLKRVIFGLLPPALRRLRSAPPVATICCT